MFDLFRELSDWVVGFADGDWSALVLAVNSFTESIFFPIPPDPLLIAIAIIRPESALWMAGIATVSSVAGAIVGHWLGGRFGRPILDRFVAQRRIETVERLFKKHGMWAVLMAAFTPIPYKVFAISAGVLDMDRRTFIIASLAGRSARFFILGGLLFAFGEDIEEFIDDNFETLTLAVAAAVAMGVGIIAVIAWRRRARETVG